MLKRFPFFFIMFILIYAVFSLFTLRDGDYVISEDQYTRYEYVYLGVNPEDPDYKLYQEAITFKNYKSDYTAMGPIYSFPNNVDPVGSSIGDLYSLDEIGTVGSLYFAGDIVVDPSISVTSYRDGRSYTSYFCRINQGHDNLSFYDPFSQRTFHGLANPDELLTTYKYTDYLYLCGYLVNSECFTEYGLAPNVTASDIDIALYSTYTGRIISLSSTENGLSTSRVQDFMRDNYFDPNRYVSVLQFGMVYRYYSYPLTQFVDMFSPGSAFLETLDDGFSLLDVITDIADNVPPMPDDPDFSWNTPVEWLVYVVEILIYAFQSTFMFAGAAIRSLFVLFDMIGYLFKFVI